MSDDELPEWAQRRTSKFDGVAARVRGFVGSLEKLLHPIGDDENLDSASLDHVLALLQLIFESSPARKSYVQAPPDARGQLWINDSLLEQIELMLQIVRSNLENLTDVSQANYHIGELRKHLKAAVRRAKFNDFSYLPEVVRQDLHSLISDVSEQLQRFETMRGIAALEGRAEAAVSKTEAAAEVAAKAAGKTGDDAMSSFYAKLAEDEGTNANKFRKLTVAFAIAGGTAAAIFVLLPAGILPQLDVSATDFVRLLQKAIFIAGIFGIAGYFARQAHQHRSMANWAGSLAVQLQTFDAYIAAVESRDVKDELRKAFAARAFGEHPAMKGEPTASLPATMVEKAMDVAAKAVTRP